MTKQKTLLGFPVVVNDELPEHDPSKISFGRHKVTVPVTIHRKEDGTFEARLDDSIQGEARDNAKRLLSELVGNQ